MDLLLKEFQDDLKRVKKLLVFIKTLQTYAGTTPSAGATAETHNVHTQSVACHADLTILVGTMILYLGGRFEHFVRTEFEEMCDTIAVRCNSYDRLPKEMRQTLIVRTAEVMSNPRKYGHADKGVEAFIKNLAENMNDRTQLRAINSACLSITYENMRPTILQDLFDRVGAKELWKSVGEQAPVKLLFETSDSAHAKNEAQSLLNKFMDVRNTIAHPSGNITWPGAPEVESYILFLEVLADALSQIVQVYTVSLVTKPPAAPVVAALYPVGAAPATEGTPGSTVTATVEPTERLTVAVTDPTLTAAASTASQAD